MREILFPAAVFGGIARLRRTLALLNFAQQV